MNSFKVGDHIFFNNDGPGGVLTKNTQGVITEIDNLNKRITIELDKPIKYFTFNACNGNINIGLVEDKNETR